MSLLIIIPKLLPALDIRPMLLTVTIELGDEVYIQLVEGEERAFPGVPLIVLPLRIVRYPKS